MVKRKRSKDKQPSANTLNRKLKIEQHELH
jgi:hypothetical protein